MQQELTLLSADPNIAFEAMQWTEKASVRAGLDAPRAERLATAVIEAVNNSLEHGYHMQPGTVAVTLEDFTDRIEVAISDSGRGLPAAPAAGCPSPLAERGRGSWIMQQVCDAVRHEFPIGLQRVVLVMKRTPSIESSTGDIP